MRWWLKEISIHAPRTGSDLLGGRCAGAGEHFNPRSPHGERHFRHALQADQRHFNPRSPHGERPAYIKYVEFIEGFQSTLPARGATA